MSEGDEQRIRDVLQRMDSLLDIRWFRHAFFNERHEVFEGRYALVCKWMPNDKRWELVQTGEIAEEEAIDLLAWFTRDKQNAETPPVEEGAIENLALELLGSIDATRFPFKQRMLSIAEKNVAARKNRRAEVLDEAHDEFGSWWYHLTPKVSMYAPTQKETKNVQSNHAGSATRQTRKSSR